MTKCSRKNLIVPIANSCDTIISNLSTKTMEEGSISLQTPKDAIQKIKTDMLTHFDSKMDPIHGSLCNIQSSLNTLGERVSELEQCVSSNEDNVQDLQNQLQQLKKENAYLVDKVEDLENRSRSSNCFIRVPELVEGRNVPVDPLLPLGEMTEPIFDPS